MMTEASDIYPKIAEKYGLSVEQVRDIVIYFWRTGVKRSLENIIRNEIYISQLGSFKLKDYKLKYIIPSSYLMSQNIEGPERNREYFQMLNTRLIEVEKSINEKKLKRKEFELYKSNSSNIPKQETNLGRTEEQTNQE